MTDSSARRLKGRRALVTGAGSGIGRACAARLAGEGASVAVCDVRGPLAAGAVAAIVAAGGRAIDVETDVGAEESVIEAIHETIAVFGVST